MAVGVAGAQERWQDLLIVAGPMEHLLAYAVLDDGHLCSGAENGKRTLVVSIV